MERKKVIDTNPSAAITAVSYEAQILIEEGKRAEENPCLAKPWPARCSLNKLETEEALMML